jgi:hypothetical protein
VSKLALIGRPWVAFDATNSQHREWFAEFQKLGTWGKCPVRFIIPDDHGDLITMIHRRLIDFYVGQVFNHRVKPLNRSPFDKAAA